MAPADAEGRRKPREAQFLFNPGVQGRKTGITVPDTGIRDENGLEPMDDLFSSPAKTAPKSSKSTRKTNGTTANANATINTSEEMDVDDGTVPDPADVLTERKRANMKMPLPRSKSPHKTYLQSPARRNASLGPHSPVRSVIRKLDFSVNDGDNSSFDESALNGKGKRALSQPFNGTRLSPPNESSDVDDTDNGMAVNGEDSMQQIEYSNGNVELPDQLSEPEPEPESEPEPEPEPELEEAPARPGRKRKTAPTVTAAVVQNGVKKARGRPAKVRPVVEEVEEEPAEEASEEQEEPQETEEANEVEEEEDIQPKKRRRSGRKSEESAAVTTSKKPLAKGKTSKTSKPESENPKPKKAGRKPRTEQAVEVDSPQVIRGPPLPKNSRGLVILRRETPNGSSGFQQTRSGRNSIKPLAFWRGEKIEWDETNEAVDGKGKIILPTIKEVVRTEEVDGPKRHANKRSTKKSKKRAAESESEDDEEIEPWEVDPGRITGDVREWDPMDPVGQEANDKEEELALSAAAIITREIAGAQFRFAKTLTLPFFGSGMVDLPPGAVKKPKNSRKMQMVFFVHYGRVQVTVNDNVFRIGKGGMWQVPRGNFYSITNDYAKPARIFFSQGNEIVEEAEDSQ